MVFDIWHWIVRELEVAERVFMGGKRNARHIGVMFTGTAFVAVAACRPASDGATQPAPARTSAPVPAAPAAPTTTLDFDPALRSDDETANAFVERAMQACAEGDYDAVRAMWTVRGQPLSQPDFEKNWQNVKRITLRAMKAVGLAGEAVGSPYSPQPGFALMVDVQLDPATVAAGAQPGRQVVLTMVKENDEWRLASAPKSVRLWLESELGRVVIPTATGGAEHP